MIFDNPVNLTNVTEVLEYADLYTGGFLGVLILVVIGFGSLFLTSNFNMRESFVATSFILVFASIFLKYLNMLSDKFLWISVVLFIVSLIISFAKSSEV